MTSKTWYFGPTADLDMCSEDDEHSGWVWIADNPDGLLDDSHITDYIEAILPPGFCEQCESIFNHTSDSYEEVRKLLVEAGFVEARLNNVNDNDDDEDDGSTSAPASEVKLENAPETLEAAVARIQALEQALDNVCYGLEISEFTGKYDHVKPYVVEAFELLKTRIPHQSQDVKADRPVTLYEGKGVITQEHVDAVSKHTT